MAKHFNSYQEHGNWTFDQWVLELQNRFAECQTGLEDGQKALKEGTIPQEAYDMVERDCDKMENTLQKTKEIF